MKKIILWGIVIIFIALTLLSFKKVPDQIQYGVSFSAFHSRELGLEWKPVYDAILNDLGVRRFRFSAHWPITEPQDDTYSFTELDYQVREAEKVGAKAVLAVGRRLPGWPECHEPEWAHSLSRDEKRAEMLELITTVVNRYKDSPAIEYWQVENEPFLTIFATHHCGDLLDKEFLQKEVALVRSLDSSRPILVTDSGELSLWKDAYQSGDSFGTSVYIYVWSHKIGPMRYPIPPAFFRIKRNIIELIYGKKESILIELSAEPWLLQPIIDTPMDTALSRMDIDKFNNVIKFAKKTSFEKQYLWGAEWWYYMKENKHPEFWERAQEIF